MVLVKLKDKDKLKVKPCKTIISEEEPPPALLLLGNILLKLLPGFLRMKLGLSLVTGRECSFFSPRWPTAVGCRGHGVAGTPGVRPPGVLSPQFGADRHHAWIDTCVVKFRPNHTHHTNHTHSTHHNSPQTTTTHNTHHTHTPHTTHTHTTHTHHNTPHTTRTPHTTTLHKPLQPTTHTHTTHTQPTHNHTHTPHTPQGVSSSSADLCVLTFL